MRIARQLKHRLAGRDPALAKELDVERDVLRGEKVFGPLGRIGLTKAGRAHKAEVRAGVREAEQTIRSNREQARYIRAVIDPVAAEVSDYAAERIRIADLDFKKDPTKYPQIIWDTTQRIIDPITAALNSDSGETHHTVFDSLDLDAPQPSGLAVVDVLQRLVFSTPGAQERLQQSITTNAEGASLGGVSIAVGEERNLELGYMRTGPDIVLVLSISGPLGSI